jgi:Fe-S oxidoreductase
MTVSGAFLLLLLFGASCLFALRASRLFAPIRMTARAQRFDRPGLRLAGLARAIGLHERLLQIRFAGIVHILIFTSFLVLASAIVQSFGAGLAPGFSLRPVGGDSWLAWLQDVFAVVMLTGVALAAWQRYVLKPDRFRGSNTTDATVIYLLIAAIVGGMLLEAALSIVAGTSASAAWRPVSRSIAALLSATGLSAAAAARGAAAAGWVHVCAILAFLVYIPGSKHRHMVLAFANVYFRDLKPKGELAPPEAPSASLHPLSWKDALDLYSCTECGRCQAACPAYAAGQPLSPKLLIMDIRDWATARGEGERGPLIGGAVSRETLWACTTCRACMEVCPVHIEHLPKIVDLRRMLVDAGDVDPLLQSALTNLQRSGNSMGQASKMRARWTRGLPFKIKDARKEPVDVLWFVGDFASYDPRVQETTRKVAIALSEAGVDFGILYDGEQNSGNDVRRAGEEGLFQTLAQRNIETLAGCRFRRILTTDPHSFNALAQDYRQLGARFDVVHYAQLLLELIEAGRLRLKPAAGQTVTYHDPCYLGRYNGGFDAPRKVIALAGYRLREMGRCRENSFCCGAGGGRIWADDSGVKERPSENRIREALSLGDASLFVVACPKDKVMYKSAVEALGVDDRIEVRDLIELVEVASSS